MKIYAINGSPRKKFNTASLLNAFLDGVKAVDASIETELVNLYDYDYKGCYECYLCKMKHGKFYGECGYRDGIRELLKDVSHSDGVVFGSPVFLGEINGQMHSFLERLIYPFKIFDKNQPPVMPPKKLRTAFIYTMNLNEEQIKADGYPSHFKTTQDWLSFVFGYEPELLYAYNTYQYSDYSRYIADFWDVEDKKQWHEEQFPKDCETAFAMGKQMAEQAIRDKEEHV